MDEQRYTTDVDDTAWMLIEPIIRQKPGQGRKPLRGRASPLVWWDRARSVQSRVGERRRVCAEGDDRGECRAVGGAVDPHAGLAGGGVGPGEFDLRTGNDRSDEARAAR